MRTALRVVCLSSLAILIPAYFLWAQLTRNIQATIVRAFSETDESEVVADPEFDYLRHKYPPSDQWGRYKSEDPENKERLAIIIPFRDREVHLIYLIKHLIPFLVRQKADFQMFVAEQAGEAVFNHGLILNAGIREIVKRYNFTCFIFHDVDLFPLIDENIYGCRKQPYHLAPLSTLSCLKLRPYPYTGGVISMTPEQFYKVNGYSNLYFGWGGEDDDLRMRVHYAGMKYEVAEHDIGMYFAYPHIRDKKNPVNNNRRYFYTGIKHRMATEGFSSVKYKATVVPKEFYTHIMVSFNLEDYPRPFYNKLKKLSES